MKAPLAIIVLMAAGLGVSALATRFGDRQTMTSPPDGVLEGFVRQVVQGHYDIATKYVSVSQGTTMDVKTLKAWFEPRRGQLGAVNTVDTGIDRMDGARASARAIVAAEHASLVLKAPLVWERGGWRIAALPEEVQLTRHRGEH
jgi:hypothetical protein